MAQGRHAKGWHEGLRENPKLPALVLAGNLLVMGASVAVYESRARAADCAKDCGRLVTGGVFKDPMPPKIVRSLTPVQTPKPSPKPVEVHHATPKPTPKPSPTHIPQFHRQGLRRARGDQLALLKGDGFDYSWPDDPSKGLPLGSFVTLGLTHISQPDKLNEYLPGQLAWAKEHLGPARTMFYAVPKLDKPNSSGWPKKGTTPYKDSTCRGGDTRACAYVEGEQDATNALNGLKRSARTVGFTLQAGQVVALDVEYSRDHTNFMHDTPTAQRDNVAALEGEQHVFEAAGFSVMLYSSEHYWSSIAGNLVGPRSGSTLDGLKEWQPIHKRADNEARTIELGCDYLPFIDGDDRKVVVEVQDQTTINGVIRDWDHIC